VVAPKTLGDMMMAFKSITTVEYIKGVKNLGWQSFERRLWQRNYYEHIIRDELAYFSISKYIINNPSTPQRSNFRNNKSQYIPKQEAKLYICF
jgi:REP element-mobilizing transposase RayT